MNIAPYQQFQNQLKDLGIALPNHQRQPGALIRQGQQFMIFWQTHLAPMTGDNLSPEVYGQWRSLHTELYRGLRLLNADLIFLQGSRCPDAQADKQLHIQTRLEQLSQYCQRIIDLAGI
ncbi:heterocyst frequency control protein PatD [Picosynechococcus sp. NKBG15041c]|uniref:heterocyst frequency control protein PatD n=1 Tax=Picosynechococcus sp. NKBG15041c TaxID=1407650 RepID=UPI0003F70036|nr:heterocyst frequency control protein PatD [Picosynechococcus sp. NKBG15041c]